MLPGSKNLMADWMKWQVAPDQMFPMAQQAPLQAQASAQPVEGQGINLSFGLGSHLDGQGGNIAGAATAGVDNMGVATNETINASAPAVTPNAGLGSFMRSRSGTAASSTQNSPGVNAAATGVNGSPAIRNKRKSVTRNDLEPLAKRLQAPASASNNQAVDQTPPSGGQVGQVNPATPAIERELRPAVRSGIQAALQFLEAEAHDRGMLFERMFKDGVGTTFDAFYKENLIATTEAKCLEAMYQMNQASKKIAFNKAASETFLAVLNEAEESGIVMGCELRKGKLDAEEVRSAHTLMTRKYTQIVDEYERTQEQSATSEGLPNNGTPPPETPSSITHTPHHVRHMHERSRSLPASASTHARRLSTHGLQPQNQGLQQQHHSFGHIFSSPSPVPNTASFESNSEGFMNTVGMGMATPGALVYGQPSQIGYFSGQGPVPPSMANETFPSYNDPFQNYQSFSNVASSNTIFDMPSNGGLNNGELHGQMPHNGMHQNGGLGHGGFNNGSFNNGAPS
ncbi:hypothetical protein QBC43DRAFT_299838 [Cladorrhinum sp. PSN259]|nr:hypothetical protein QBC43DRAFT_299838 [Cladorrhinum sp. PSN259]